jgi:hypothetical protein
MLHGEGVETYESDTDPALSGLGSPLMQREYRLYIVDEADAARANDILIELGAYRGPPVRRVSRHPSWALRIFLLAVGVLVIVVAFL